MTEKQQPEPTVEQTPAEPAEQAVEQTSTEQAVEQTSTEPTVEETPETGEGSTLAELYRNITGLDPAGLTDEQLNAVVHPGA